MYKIYEFYKEPCDDKSECLVADIETEELAYKCMLGCFTTRNNSGKKYYSFADNAVHADIIRAKLWYNIDRSKTGFVLYTVYAFNKTGETTHVYPIRVFTEYRDALDEALKFGSFCNDWIFLVDTSIDDALINYTIHHADRVNAQYSVHNADDALINYTIHHADRVNALYSVHNADDGQGVWNELKVLSAEGQNIVKTEENCYYSDGMLCMKEIREYYDTGDMNKEESKDET